MTSDFLGLHVPAWARSRHFLSLHVPARARSRHFFGLRAPDWARSRHFLGLRAPASVPPISPYNIPFPYPCQMQAHGARKQELSYAAITCPPCPCTAPASHGRAPARSGASSRDGQRRSSLASRRWRSLRSCRRWRGTEWRLSRCPRRS